MKRREYTWCIFQTPFPELLLIMAIATCTSALICVLQYFVLVASQLFRYNLRLEIWLFFFLYQKIINFCNLFGCQWCLFEHYNCETMFLKSSFLMSCSPWIYFILYLFIIFLGSKHEWEVLSKCKLVHRLAMFTCLTMYVWWDILLVNVDLFLFLCIHKYSCLSLYVHVLC